MELVLVLVDACHLTALADVLLVGLKERKAGKEQR